MKARLLALTLALTGCCHTLYHPVTSKPIARLYGDITITAHVTRDTADITAIAKTSPHWRLVAKTLVDVAETAASVYRPEAAVVPIADTLIGGRRVQNIQP